MILNCMIIYLIVINLFGLILMAIDKSKAVRHRWRIPEKTLFLVAIIGGSVGVWIGMYACRHKTKHASFVVGVPVILILQIVLICMIEKSQGWQIPFSL